MNNRGSALVNVVSAIAVLMILGVAALQLVTSDAVFALRDRQGAQALQLAEGGIDFGMELLVRGPVTVLGEGRYWPGLNTADSTAEQPFVISYPDGTVWVTVEEDILAKHFRITSRAQTGNTSRTLQAVVRQYETGNPFPYSLYVAGKSESDPESTDYDLHLRNVTIEGSVYIAANRVYLDQGTSLNGDAHFESTFLRIHNSTSFDIYRNVATCEPNTELQIDSNQSKHWGYTITRESQIVPWPEIPINDYQYMEEFTVWDRTTIGFHELKDLNYFAGDITIVLQKDQYPNETKMVVAAGGSINFDRVGGNFQFLPPVYTTLILMAEKDIYDIDKLTNQGGDKQAAIDLYLYAKGDITTAQNVVMSSVMAQVVTMHNQQQVIKKPDPDVFYGLPQQLQEDWGVRGFEIIKWIN